MVIMIPMPSFTGSGAGPWRDRPSIVGLVTSAAFFAGYLSIPLYNRAVFIDLPTVFGIQVSKFGIQSLSVVFAIVLAMAYIFTALFTLLGAETVRWWEWTVFVVSLLLALFWILPLIAAGNSLAGDFCQSALAQGQGYWVTGCY